jgi:hypothetical protein
LHSWLLYKYLYTSTPLVPPAGLVEPDTVVFLLLGRAHGTRASGKAVHQNVVPGRSEDRILEHVLGRGRFDKSA